MIPAGQIIGFDFGGTAGGWVPTTEDEIRSEIIGQLSQAFTVANLDLHSTGAIYEMLEWEFVGRLEVSPLQGFANMEDARSVVVHSIYEATGYMPTVTAPGAGWSPLGSGGLTEWLSGLGSGLQQTSNLLLIGTAVVLVALVVSMGGKTTRLGLG